MLALGLLALARAGDTFVYEGFDAAVATAWSDRAGVADARVLSVGELTAGRAPIGLAGARVVPCTDAPTPLGAMTEPLKRAEGSLAYMEYGAARTDLLLAANALTCLNEPVKAELAARIYYIHGILAFNEGKPDEARAWFARAKSFQKGLQWDEDFPPDAREAFDAAAADLVARPPVWLEIVPAPAPGTLWIDGNPAAAPEGRVALPPGNHLLQIGASTVATLSVEMKEGADGTLVIPAALPTGALGWAGDPTRRGALSAALAATLQRDAVVYVASGDRLWKVHAGGDDWEELKVARPVVRTAKDRRNGLVGSVLMGVGGAALVGGGVLAGVSYGTASDAVRENERATEWATVKEQQARYDAAERTYLIGDAVAGGGAALLALGVVIAF